MKKSTRDKWCEALRSKKFDKGTDYLHNITTNQYCCLGVLCKIFDKFNLSKTFMEIEIAYANDKGSLLDDSLLKFFGLPEEQMYELTQLNDTTAANFDNIADWIESNVRVEDDLDILEPIGVS